MRGKQMRIKLLKLLRSAPYIEGKVSFETLVDYLLANGVTIGKDTNVPGKWIPVTERLPENNTTVLVYRPTMAIKLMQSYFYNRFCDGALDIRGNEVITHWMPLPEPPKEGNDA